MPMTPEQRKQVAKDIYQDLILQGNKPAIARAILQERHGLTEEQLDNISPRPKPSYPKPQPPPRAALESELQTAAAMLRTVAAGLRSPKQTVKDYAMLAKNVDQRAKKIETLLNYAQKKEKPNA